MSRPPTPEQERVDLPDSTQRYSRSLEPVINISASVSHPDSTAHIAALPQEIPRTQSSIGLSSAPTYSLFQQSPPQPSSEAYTTVTNPSYSRRTTTESRPISGPSNLSAPRAISSGGRRSHTHVASACVHCKKAHLSCDNNRPCLRCIHSGKQDTCVDVQHKKRGRPRLRDEPSARIEQVHSDLQPRSAATTTSVTGQMARPIAIPRTTRRNTTGQPYLRPQSTIRPSIEASSALVSPTTYQSPWSSRQANITPAHPSADPPYEVPTAYLNLDLEIVRANRSFWRALHHPDHSENVPIVNMVRSADGSDLRGIRDLMRAEREARDPAYMPPIISEGRNPIRELHESDVERYTTGMTEHNYLWTREQQFVPDRVPESFPVQVRLARAKVYFIAVTIPARVSADIDQSWSSPTTPGLRARTYSPRPGRTSSELAGSAFSIPSTPLHGRSDARRDLPATTEHTPVQARRQSVSTSVALPPLFLQRTESIQYSSFPSSQRSLEDPPYSNPSPVSYPRIPTTGSTADATTSAASGMALSPTLEATGQESEWQPSHKRRRTGMDLADVLHREDT